MTRLARSLALALALPAAALAQAPAGPGAPGGPDAPRQTEAPAAAAAPAPAPARAPRALLAEIDASYAQRDDPARLAAHRARLAEAEQAAPADYEVLWRQSRIHFWLADDPKLAAEEKSRLGKIGWDYGDRATAADPSRVEGWHFAAAGVGNYALGIGVLKALRQGIEGKFKERLSRAEQIDAGFQDGAIQTAWGRFWYELPWPKYDPGRSRRSLEAALARNPANVRARVYLADLATKEDQGEEARSHLAQALAGAPGRYDAPEERRWQEVARRRLSDR